MSSKTFIQYTHRLGYPEYLAQHALSRLGVSASTDDLLGAVMAEARRCNVRPGGSYVPVYFTTQDSYRAKDGNSKTPQWVNFTPWFYQRLVTLEKYITCLWYSPPMYLWWRHYLAKWRAFQYIHHNSDTTLIQTPLKGKSFNSSFTFSALFVQSFIYVSFKIWIFMWFIYFRFQSESLFTLCLINTIIDEWKIFPKYTEILK